MPARPTRRTPLASWRATLSRAAPISRTGVLFFYRDLYIDWCVTHVSAERSTENDVFEIALQAEAIRGSQQLQAGVLREVQGLQGQGRNRAYMSFFRIDIPPLPSIASRMAPHLFPDCNVHFMLFKLSIVLLNR